jgi:hypothetical protein
MMDTYNAYFFKYSSDDGSASIDMVNYQFPKLDGTVTLWSGKLSPGYTILEVFYQNNELYLLAYAPGTIQFYSISTTQQDEFLVLSEWQGGYEAGWTHLKPYYDTDGSVNIFQFKSAREDPAYSKKTLQTVAINQITAQASGISTGWRSQWKGYWKILEPFYYNFLSQAVSEPCLLMNDPYTVKDHNVDFDRIETADGTVNKWTGHWKTGWTIIKPFYMGMTPYIFGYADLEDSPPVTVDFINDNIQGTKEKWRDSWSKGWTIIQPFYLNYPNMTGPIPYLITYRGYSKYNKTKYTDGAVTFNQISAYGHGEVNEIWRDKWPKTLTHIVPFNLTGKDYPFAG